MLPTDFKCPLSNLSEAGLERARRNRKVWKAPMGSERWALILTAVKEQAGISRETGLSYVTAKRYLKRLETSASGPALSINEASKA